MRKNITHIFWTLSLSLILPLVLEANPDVKLSAIKESLICSCECSMTVDACEGSMTCNTAKNLTSMAMGLITKGYNEKEILSIFVNRYGEQILSAPEKKGFNLIAWIFPFVAFSLAGFGIVILLRKWAVVSPNSVVFYEEDIPSRIDKRYEQQLNEELKGLD